MQRQRLPNSGGLIRLGSHLFFSFSEYVICRRRLIWWVQLWGFWTSKKDLKYQGCREQSRREKKILFELLKPQRQSILKAQRILLRLVLDKEIIYSPPGPCQGRVDYPLAFTFLPLPPMTQITFREARTRANLSMRGASSESVQHDPSGKWVSFSAINFIESGRLKKAPHGLTVRLLAKTYNVQPESLVYVPFTPKK